MRLKAVNGHPGDHAPWRGALVVRGVQRSGGALLDPTGTLSARLLVEPALRQACGLDRPTVPVLLTRAQLDQISALIELRHGNPIDLYTTPALFERLSSATAIWPALQERCAMHWRMVPLGGDSHEARFQVEGQRGVTYTALCAEPETGSEEPATVLLIGNQASGAQVACVHGTPQDLHAVQAMLDTHWPAVKWLAMVIDETADTDAVQWLAAQPVAGKLLLGGDPDLQAWARPQGVVPAEDGLEIVVE